MLDINKELVGIMYNNYLKIIKMNIELHSLKSSENSEYMLKKNILYKDEYYTAYHYKELSRLQNELGGVDADISILENPNLNSVKISFLADLLSAEIDVEPLKQYIDVYNEEQLAALTALMVSKEDVSCVLSPNLPAMHMLYRGAGRVVNVDRPSTLVGVYSDISFNFNDDEIAVSEETANKIKEFVKIYTPGTRIEIQPSDIGKVAHYCVDKKEWFRYLADNEKELGLLAKENYEKALSPKSVAVYQLKDGYDDVAFYSYDRVKELDFKIIIDKYNLVYAENYDKKPHNETLYNRFNMEHPKGYFGHSLSVGDVIVVTDEKSVSKAYFCDKIGFVELLDFITDTMEVDIEELNRNTSDVIEVDVPFPTEDVMINVGGYVVVVTHDSAEECFDYTIYEKDSKLIYDGGIVTIDNDILNLKDVCADILNGCLAEHIITPDEYTKADYNINADDISEFEEKALEIETFKNQFRSDNLQKFNNIGDLSYHDVLTNAELYICNKLSTFDNDINLSRIGSHIEMIGSRCRGFEKDGSDIDIVFEFKSNNIKEDTLFNILHEDNPTIDGIKLDINPIRADKTGTIIDYLKKEKTSLDLRTIVNDILKDDAKTVNEINDKDETKKISAKR